MDTPHDPVKAAANARKHKAEFAGCEAIFDGVFTLDTENRSVDYDGEERRKCIGFVGPVVMALIYTTRDGEVGPSPTARRSSMKSKPSAKPTVAARAVPGSAPYFPTSDAEWEALKAAAPPGPALSDAELTALDEGVLLPGGLTMAERRAAIDAHAAKRRHGQRGPQKAPTKVQVSFRMAADTLARWKATGPGWQGRMDAWLAKGPA